MSEPFDFVVIGSGPGGQKAAICAAKAGCRVALVEQDARLGGACVFHGTIPSKTLRENAVRLQQLARAAELLGVEPRQDLELGQLLGRLEGVVQRYGDTVREQLLRNGVECVHGRGRFVAPQEVEVLAPGGGRRSLAAAHVVLAVGSKPRTPDGIPVDHEHVLDGDSILSLAYLPESLAVLGGGVIACEYASIFARLGVRVSLIDRAPRPLGFVDEELVGIFLEEFATMGGRHLPERRIEAIGFDGVSRVALDFAGEERLEAEKVFVALGRTPCLEGLNIGAAGLRAGERGILPVDEDGRSEVPHIYAVGDVAGPPALATSAMEQGRRAVRRALGLPAGRLAGLLPTGIYTIPEMATVGSSEEEVRAAHGGARVGRARFSEVARGQISGLGGGLLKLVADPEGDRLLGVQIVGESATELVHIGQMALCAGARVEDLLENVFNFPTLAEAYRIAALDLSNQVAEKQATLPL